MIYSLIYCLFFVYEELIYHIFEVNAWNNSIVSLLLYSLFLGCLFGLINHLLPKVVQKHFLRILVLIISVYYGFALVIKKTFNITISLSATSMVKNFTGDFLKTALETVGSNIVYILLVLLPFILICVLSKLIPTIDLLKGKKIAIQIVLTLLCFALFFGSLLIGISSDAYSQYFKHNDYDSSVNTFGVVPTIFISGRKELTNFQEEIEIVEPEEVIEVKDYSAQIDKTLDFSDTDNDKINQMNTYFQSESVTYKNDYTGLFEGKNLIYIMAESFDGYFVDPELTPALYKMIHSGLYFENYYSPTNLSTIGGEFSLLNGLLPDLTCLNTRWENEDGSYDNYYPYGLGTLFKNEGYSTYAYHDHEYDYQNRDNYLKAVGFDNYLGCGNGLEERMACNIFPKSDDEMIKATYEDYINDEHFMVYYATVSGHGNWAIGNSAMADKNAAVVEDMDYSTIVKRYIAANMELEYAMETLLDVLEENGRLEDTVIVLAADHHPYMMSDTEMNELAGKTLDKFETYRNNLIIYNSEMEYTPISKVCNTIDVLPTTLNLFGIDYDSRIIIGKDILDPNTDGLVILSDYSFITDKGTYDEDTGIFTANQEIEDEEAYVNRISTIVYNRYLMSEYIMKYSYYKKLFDQ